MIIHKTALLVACCSIAVSAAAQNGTAGRYNFTHVPGTSIKEPHDSLVVHKTGAGDVPVVLITGHMQPHNMYADFIERNREAARYYVVVPPGMGYTPAYPWPAKKEDFISRPWSSTFEDELARYIDVEINEKPFIVAHWFTGLGAAIHIADKYPEKVRGLLLVGPAGRSPYCRLYRQNSTSTELFDTATQREVVKKKIIKWRRIEEFDWQRHMFPPEFYSNNRLAGSRVVHTADQHPVPITLRYFIEYLMDDLTREIKNLSVPTLTVTIQPENESINYRPSGNPSHVAWNEPLPVNTRRDWMADTNEKIHVEFIQNSGLLPWIDQPGRFDQLFLKFIQNH